MPRRDRLRYYRRRIIDAVGLSLVAAAAAAAARGDIVLTQAFRSIACIELGSGLVLAMLLSRARLLWPLYLACGLGAAASAGICGGRPAAPALALALALALACISAAQVAGAAWLLRRRLGATPDLSVAATFAKFVLIGSALAPTAAALPAAALLHLVAGTPLLGSFVAWARCSA